MPSSLNVIVCGVGAFIFWGAVGFALSRRITPTTLALSISPALGWAVHSAIALPLYRYLGFTTWTVVVGTAVTLAGALIFLLRAYPKDNGDLASGVSYYAYFLAILLGVIPAFAIFPKISGEVATLAPPIFDHAKVAMIDEMTRLGVPPGNPFFDAAGQGLPLAYYYLWHFSAAEMSLSFNVSGWESDIALTGFTAISSLLVMTGLASWIGGRAAGVWVVPLALVGSLYPALKFLVGGSVLYSIIQPPTGFSGWLFQSAWAPQHLASAYCVVLSTYLLVQLAQRPSALLAVVLALVATAGFESSTWVGGFLFAAAAPVVAVILFVDCPPNLRGRFALMTFAAAILVGALAYPFLHDQWISAAGRQSGSPIEFSPYPVFSGWASGELGEILNIPAYWLVALIIEFPAIYVPGLISLLAIAREKTATLPIEQTTKAFLGLTLVSLLVAGYVSINFAENNDLGWRAVLPGVLLLTTFAAIAISRWLASRALWAIGGAFLLLALGLPRSAQLVTEYLRGTPSPSDMAFSATPAMWEAVRRSAAPTDRIANNPQFMERMTPWTVNISWALLSNRRSCFAGRNLALPFTSLPAAEVDAIEEKFRRVFDGQGTPGDVGDLAIRYHCSIAVLTSQDGAWLHDPFANGSYYTLAEEKIGQWKIYNVIEASKIAPR
jgi:hypothetical protein